jgi:hypothetical protein
MVFLETLMGKRYHSQTISGREPENVAHLRWGGVSKFLKGIRELMRTKGVPIEPS